MQSQSLGDRLTELGRGQELRRGEVLFNQGDPASSVFWISRGRLRLERHLAGGQVVTLSVARALRLGAAILDQEEHLQRRFAQRHIDELSLRQTTAEISRLYGELRFAHLTAHVKTTELLTAEQVEIYDGLRGYH